MIREHSLSVNFPTSNTTDLQSQLTQLGRFILDMAASYENGGAAKHGHSSSDSFLGMMGGEDLTGFIKQCLARAPFPKPAPERETTRTIAVFDGERNIVIDTEDILYLKAEHVYIRLYMEGRQKPFILRHTFDEMLDKLPAGRFLRTHRSYAVNVGQVDSWNKQVVRVKGHEVPVSRRRKSAVADYMAGRG